MVRARRSAPHLHDLGRLRALALVAGGHLESEQCCGVEADDLGPRRVGQVGVEADRVGLGHVERIVRAEAEAVGAVRRD